MKDFTVSNTLFIFTLTICSK